MRNVYERVFVPSTGDHHAGQGESGVSGDCRAISGGLMHRYRNSYDCQGDNGWGTPVSYGTVHILARSVASGGPSPRNSRWCSPSPWCS